MTDTDAQLIDRLEAGAERRSERREFFRTALGAGAVAVAGAAAVTIGSRAIAQASSDTDILNFALNLEYLEAQFYSYAVFGTGLPNSQLTPGSANTTTQGAVSASGAHAVAFSDPIVARYAREIAGDETQHVAFLRNTLGTVAVAQPAIDLSVSSTSAFTLAGRAAGLAVNSSGAVDNTNGIFDPYASDANFLLAAFIFEDVGVTAYKGAASLLSSKTYLDAAAGILAAEAYHASIIRTVLDARGLGAASEAISNVRDGLDGKSDDDQGVAQITIANSQYSALNGLSASNIVPTGQDGIAYGRAVGNVLNIVYLNSLPVTKGGFFPNGTNGSYATASSN